MADVTRNFQSVNGQVDADAAPYLPSTLAIVMLFDRPRLNGEPVVIKPINERPNAMEPVIVPEPRIKVRPHNRTECPKFLEQAFEINFEAQVSHRVMQIVAVD
jgi:ATP-dependent DNA ligase